MHLFRRIFRKVIWLRLAVDELGYWRAVLGLCTTSTLVRWGGHTERRPWQPLNRGLVEYSSTGGGRSIASVEGQEARQRQKCMVKALINGSRDLDNDLVPCASSLYTYLLSISLFLLFQKCPNPKEKTTQQIASLLTIGPSVSTWKCTKTHTHSLSIVHLTAKAWRALPSESPRGCFWVLWSVWWIPEHWTKGQTKYNYWVCAESDQCLWLSSQKMKIVLERSLCSLPLEPHLQ